MAISKKHLIAFFLTIIMVISLVQCSDSFPGFGIKQEWKKCFSHDPCKKAGTQGCMEFCRDISFLLYGECTPTQCCCISKTK
ncbi:hypothetical protein CARUB_v10028585mg [Capsella rubella]|uniref:Knottin scorpion toxin-like domain-containing protein n=1 Tax=Capsella rubella TaxID=81985 RepID=R0F0S0_9BRAS|nr:defensin-like protein 115 [Capsella rubella]EOA15197.1 hypothetical protein CARUB_v10028585mg [Capsella rubella]